MNQIDCVCMEVGIFASSRREAEVDIDMGAFVAERTQSPTRGDALIKTWVFANRFDQGCLSDQQQGDEECVVELEIQ